MNRAMKVLVVVATFSLGLMGDVYAANIRGAIRDGLKDLNAKKGDAQLCAITDATYVRVDGKTSEHYVDLIQEETGCSIGKGNLLFFHRHTSYPLKIAIFRRDTKECVVIGYEGQQTQSKKYNISLEACSEPSFWKKVDPPLDRDAFTIATFAHAWALDAPQDFLKCAEFHNHLCAGIASGYMIARFIMSKYPVQTGESYTWIASPVFCKEDAMQVLLDVTAGKKTLYVEKLRESQKEDLKFENAAGILVVWNKKASKGTGVVLEFKWDKARRKDKLQMILGMLPYLERPDEFVGVVKEFDVTPQMLERLTTAETSPYQWLGLTK
jgi:formylmethanofuran dehydrogenase subunit E-like metal-binding protein